MPQPNLNRVTTFPTRLLRSEKGIYLDALADGAVVDVVMQHHHYRLVKRDDTHIRFSGHLTLCPEPIKVEVEGSMGAGHQLAPHPGFIGPGMYLVFRHPHLEQVITSSRIREIHILS